MLLYSMSIRREAFNPAFPPLNPHVLERILSSGFKSNSLFYSHIFLGKILFLIHFPTFITLFTHHFCLSGLVLLLIRASRGWASRGRREGGWRFNRTKQITKCLSNERVCLKLPTLMGLSAKLWFAPVKKKNSPNFTVKILRSILMVLKRLLHNLFMFKELYC